MQIKLNKDYITVRNRNKQEYQFEIHYESVKFHLVKFYNKITMDGKYKHKRQGSFKSWSLLGFFLIITMLISGNSQQIKTLFNSSYFLLGQSQKIFIPISQSQLNLTNNASIRYLKVTIKIQILSQNGSYVDFPLKTGNILVKYWKNQQNTPASSVIGFSYDKLSTTKQFSSATDPVDKGMVDIEGLYNYENQHNFIHIVGNQTSDILFVLAVYRFSNYALTDLFGMSTKTDEIKITVTVERAVQSDLKCQFCSVKQFCPTIQCQCLQQVYSGCKINKKLFNPKVDSSSKINDINTIKKGTINYIQIQPETNTKEWFPVQIYLSFSDKNSTTNGTVQKNRLYLMVFVKNKSQTTETIPNIFNFDFIDSPSLSSRIVSHDIPSSVTSSQFSQISLTQPISVGADQNPVSISSTFLISKNQVVAAAIYYLPNNQQSASDPTPDELNLSMNMELGTPKSQGSNTPMLSLAFIIGMVAVGFFVLVLMICLMHFVVAKRFNIFSVFSNSQYSGRNSIQSARLSRQAGNDNRPLLLPQISFGFLKNITFMPLKYLYSSKLQQRHSRCRDSLQCEIDCHNQICSICLQEFTDQSRVKYTYCGHILDSNCIDSWFQKEFSCPMCRQKLQPKEVAEYQDKITSEIIQNQYYQQVLDEEVQTLKQLYKDWKHSPYQVNHNIQNTEQSLVNNQYYLSNNDIKDTVPNISTMAQLQRSNLQIKPKLISKIDQNPSINLTNLIIPNNFNKVFLNNQELSAKKIGKTYLFYRCIYLYHQINKKFDKDHKLYQPSQSSQIEEELKIVQFSLNQTQQLVQATPYAIKSFLQPNQREKHQHVQNYTHSEQKLKPNIQLDFEHKKTQQNLNFQFDLQQNPSIAKDQNKTKFETKIQDFSDQIDANSQKFSNQDAQTRGKKLKRQQKNKKFSMRDEMNQLERELQESEKGKKISEQYKLNNNDTIIDYQGSDSQDIRYIGATGSIVSRLENNESQFKNGRNFSINKTEVIVQSQRKTAMEKTNRMDPQIDSVSLTLNPLQILSHRRKISNQEVNLTRQRFTKKN